MARQAMSNFLHSNHSYDPIMQSNIRCIRDKENDIHNSKFIIQNYLSQFFLAIISISSPLIFLSVDTPVPAYCKRK